MLHFIGKSIIHVIPEVTKHHQDYDSAWLRTCDAASDDTRAGIIMGNSTSAYHVKETCKTRPVFVVCRNTPIEAGDTIIDGSTVYFFAGDK